MAPNSTTPGLSPKQFVDSHEKELVHIGKRISYYSGAPLSDDDAREYLQEPIAALPPRVLEELPDIELFLVPYLERLAGREIANSHRILTDKPDQRRSDPAASWRQGSKAVLMLSVNHSGGVAEYHYRFYQLISSLLAENWADDVRETYIKLLQAELDSRVYGEVDEAGWRLKQSLLRRGRKFNPQSRQFLDYARQSFEDTMTLYLHGICCDIDVEVGPQQIPSRHLRKRLEAVRALYPPPTGYTVFPEEPRVAK